MENLEYYYINRATYAIVPIDKSVSKVYEGNKIYIVNKSSKDIISESCSYFGSSYQGRCDGSKKILNMNYKLPIVIDDFNNLIFFPTSSPRFGQCLWISLNNISSYLKNDDKSRLLFYNDVCLDLEISYYSLENQIFRATMLDSLMRKRKNV